MHFEWDPAKAAANKLKHGVTFVEAATAFDDDHALVRDDDAHSEGEPRFVLIGVSATPRLLIVVHCVRGGGDVVRVISARKANPTEAFTYRSQMP